MTVKKSIIEDYNDSRMVGKHNSSPDTLNRVLKSNTYRDLSTVWVTPTRNHALDDQVVFQSWMAMLKPMNQKFCQLCIGGAEVADAYNCAIELILRDQIKWKYLLTVEVDNLPPKDGLIRLYDNVDKFDVISGLYWTKEENGYAMIYGNPADKDDPDGFIPQPPTQDIQPCNGLGMGFTLFNLDIFRKMKEPWFFTPDEGTHDLFFFEKAKKEGYKFACDTRVKVGHMDLQTRQIW